MQTGVVADVHRRVTQGGGQGLAVVVAVAGPLQFIHAMAMQQDQNFALRLRQRTFQRRLGEFKYLTAMAKSHGDRERVVVGAHVVSQHPIQYRNNRRPLAGGVDVVQLGPQAFQCRVQSTPHLLGDASDGAVDQSAGFLQNGVNRPMHSACGCCVCGAKGQGEAQYVVVHGFHQVGDAQGGLHGQLAVAMDI